MGSIYKVERVGGSSFRAQVRKADGTSVSQTFPTKVEAKRWVTFTEKQIEEGKKVSANGASTLRFGDILDAYLDAHEVDLPGFCGERLAHFPGLSLEGDGVLEAAR